MIENEFQLTLIATLKKLREDAQKSIDAVNGESAKLYFEGKKDAYDNVFRMIKDLYVRKD